MTWQGHSRVKNGNLLKNGLNGTEFCEYRKRLHRRTDIPDVFLVECCISSLFTLCKREVDVASLLTKCTRGYIQKKVIQPHSVV
jgi:hypothetical protein